MAADSAIEWTHHTWNPWTGCAKVSEGCRHCYAETWADRFGHVQWGANKARRRTSATGWRKPLAWNRQAKDEGIRLRVFPSLCDPFDDAVPIGWLADFFDLVEATPHLDWLLLTKRPQLIRERIGAVVDFHFDDGHGRGPDLVSMWIAGAAPHNVWLGVSVENQATADERIPQLLAVPAAKRFLSCEPLLGPVDLRRGIYAQWLGDSYGRGTSLDGIDWVIAGGESGPHARPMHPDWARSLRDQCQDAGVAFHFKQWGEWAPGEDVEANGTAWAHMYEDRDDGGAETHHWPDADIRKAAARRDRTVPDHHVLAGDTEVLLVGKRRAGRLLDGRTWDEVPGE